LRHISHPNIVLFLGACIDPEGCEVILIFEMVFGTQLKNFVGVPPADPDHASRVNMLLQICCALRYLHAQTPVIVHGDLKDSNIMVEEMQRHHYPRIKLLDFGLARLRTRSASPLGGTLAWVAPEVLSKACRRPQTSADVFSFGHLIGFVLTGERPFAGKPDADIRKVLQQGPIPLPRFPESCPCGPEGVSLMKSCLEYKPSARPGIEGVFASLSPWMVTAIAKHHSEPSGATTRDVVEL